MILIQLSILVCMGLICYQDMRYRAVYWICFPIAAVLFFLLKQDHAGIKDALTDAGYSLLFFTVQIILLWVYFALKHRKPVHIFKHYLGLGDVLFLVSVTFYLSPVNYILFYIGSLVLVMFYAIIQQGILKKLNFQIPLAGLQAAMLSLLIIVSNVNPNLSLYSDFWISRF